MGIFLLVLLACLVQFRSIKTLALFHIIADLLMITTVLLVLTQSSIRIGEQNGAAPGVSFFNPSDAFGFFGRESNRRCCLLRV